MSQNNNAVGDIAKTFSHMKKNGTLKILLILLALGAVLFIIGSIALEKESNNKTSDDNDNNKKEIVGLFEYKQLLEEEIEGLCMQVSGVNSVSAVVFFDEVGGSIYAQNTQIGNSSSEKTEYVIIGSGSNAHALYLGEKLPTLSGIGVVCDTGGDDGKKNELLSLLSKAYGIPMTRIYVID